MRKEFLCGAIVILASAALTACQPYGYGPYGYGGYGPYGYGAYGQNGYGTYPYGAYPPPPAAQYAVPPAATYAAPPAATYATPPAATYAAPAPPAVIETAPAQVTGSVAVVPCRKGVLWPFVREPGDCPTDAEKFANYPYPYLLGPR